VSQIQPIPLLNLFYPVSIIRVNEETGEAIRDAMVYVFLVVLASSWVKLTSKPSMAMRIR